MAEEIIPICACGKPLYQVIDKEGNVLGISHTGEDEDWHFEYFSDIIVVIPNNN